MLLRVYLPGMLLRVYLSYRPCTSGCTSPTVRVPQSGAYASHGPQGGAYAPHGPQVGIPLLGVPQGGYPRCWVYLRGVLPLVLP